VRSWIAHDSNGASIMQAKLDDLNDWVRQIERHLTDLLDRSADINWTAVEALAAAGVGTLLFPEGVAVPLLERNYKEKVHDIAGLVQAFLDKCKPIIEHDTAIVALVVASDGWIHDVEGPVSHLFDPMSNDHHVADWHGDAKGFYIDRKTKQRNAVKEVKQRAADISLWLDNVRDRVAFPVIDRLLEHAGNAATALASFLSKLATAPVPGVGEVESIFAINGLADFLASQFSEATKWIKTYLKQLDGLIRSLNDANREFVDETVFYNHNWPLATNLQ
jgi:hypothetical protein